MVLKRYFLFVTAVVTISAVAASDIDDIKQRFPFYQYALKYNFGDFMPKDQGGKFVQVEVLGTEDDIQIVQKIRNGALQAVYGNPIGWEKYEKTEIEKSVWVNRFYYLPSFARMYYLTKDKSYVADMMDIIKEWVERNPKVNNAERRTYNWRDMQVAWRSIHLSWCYYLAYDALSAADRKVILDLQQKHVEVLLAGFAKQKLNDFNHQSHGALAMLYVACLFPELDGTISLEKNAVRILEHHLNHAHYQDGGNVEQMFGYYPFQTAIFRDAYMLCKRNGIVPPVGTLNMLHKMAKYMSDVAQPDFTMPAINDSYPMDVLTSLNILSEITGKDYTGNASASEFYPDTQIAVMRNCNERNSWYVLANPAKRIGSHAHAGRLSFVMWCNRKPLLIEAGCCNYDKRIKNQWYRTSKAHNTVLIDGRQDAESSSAAEYAKMRYTENKITKWEQSDKHVYCQMASLADDPTNNGVKWNRNIILSKGEFALIVDNFDAKDYHKYDILFHLPPIEANVCSSGEVVKLYRDSTVSVIPSSSSECTNLDISYEYVYLDGEDYKAPMLTYSLEKNGSFAKAFVIAPKHEFIQKVHQEETSDGIGITVERKDGRATLFLLKNDASEEFVFGKYRTTKSLQIIEL